ncbi:uncharacterized protein LOC122319447 [Drosophila yakuba]|uniref:uncharacterized protein LOC122319447 n=1 Tax=Drosophila yakuba TaxID=7245 RepID=UPI001C89AC55|nr:uncharacterized protein LOC122319447 [Drosophila yakuba]
MVKIAELKADQLRYLLREWNLGVSGSRAELVQRLVDHENSEEVNLAHAVGNMSQQEEALAAQAAAISQLQQQMTTLTNMMAQLVNNMPTANQQQQRQQREDEIDIDDFINRKPGDKAAISHRQALVKEIANTLPDYDPGDDNSISVNQFIDRVNKVILHTTWNSFAVAIREEFGSKPDEAEIHFNMANATRRSKETVKEYCFRMSALGIRFKLSEAAVIRYVRAGLQHRELQNSIAAIHFSSMKEFRDATEAYFINRGRPNLNKKEFLPKSSTFEVKLENERRCNKFHATDVICQAAQVMRLGASNQDKLFTRLIHINEKGYNAFIDSGSQASIIRKSIADEIGADRQECFMKIVGICGGSRILTEALVLDIEIAGKIVTAKFYITEDLDLLLGQDVITCAELLWKFEPTEIELKRAVHQPVTRLEGIGKTNVVQAKIDVEGGQVVSQAPYRVSEPKKEVVAKMVDELLERDIITPSTSEYASPVVLIKKPNGSDRLCIDYRRLNKLIRKENFPVPNIEERLQEAKRFAYFSSLGLNSGYYQIEMEPESRKFTAFITTDGLFEFKRLPFGLKNAPAAFNRLMAELQKRVKKGDMIHYMDDILIGSQTFDEMYEKLERVLQVLRDCGLTLNLGKYFEKPNNITEVRPFLGLIGYFRKFVPGYAIISEPLRILLRKDQKFKSEQPQDDAFEKLKISLTSKPVVTSYRIDAENEVHTDASAIRLAGVLMQKDDDQLKPIAYYFRSTSKTEKN